MIDVKKNIMRRVERLAEKVRKTEADAFVIITDEDANWESLYYMSGFRGTAGALAVFADGSAELRVDSRYIEQAKKQSPLEVTELSGEPHKGIAESIKKHSCKKVMCEAQKTYHSTWDALAAIVCMTDGTQIIKDLRRCKDAEETALIKKAADIGSRAFTETLAEARPDMTEMQFKALLEYKTTLLGAGLGFDMIVASGLRSVMPHGRASEKKFAYGEWVTVDYGASYCGYFCDITRNITIGRPTEEALKLHALVAKAHSEAAAMLRAGVSGKEVHAKAVSVFAAEGKDKYFTHSLGHGLGLEVHEAPLLSHRKDFTLHVGDIVTVEPGLYIPNFGGMRCEDDYLITENGAVRLTESLPQKLYSL
ncbi:MAG: Xaa-Pro peptidase family protein [Synergistes sp.]|nr:Xaa-Pro peptidase family protein [Synergistes sp.]